VHTSDPNNTVNPIVLHRPVESTVGIFAEIGGEGEWRPEIWKLVEW